MKKVYVDIGRSLRIAQALNDVKNIDLAERFGVRPQQVIRWRNSQDMPVHKCQDFAEYFGMDFYKFLELGHAKG